MYVRPIYNDIVPISLFKTIHEKLICQSYSIYQRLAVKIIAFYSNFNKFSKGRHFTMERFQDNTFCEVLGL